MAEHRLRLLTPQGVYLTDINDFTRLKYVLIENGVGVLEVDLPPRYDDLLFTDSDVQVDNRIEVHRRVGGVSWQFVGQAQWLVLWSEQVFGKQRLTSLKALHANHLLN